MLLRLLAVFWTRLPPPQCRGWPKPPAVWWASQPKLGPYGTERHIMATSSSNLLGQSCYYAYWLMLGRTRLPPWPPEYWKAVAAFSFYPTRDRKKSITTAKRGVGDSPALLWHGNLIRIVILRHMLKQFSPWRPHKAEFHTRLRFTTTRSDLGARTWVSDEKSCVDIDIVVFYDSWSSPRLSFPWAKKMIRKNHRRDLLLPKFSLRKKIALAEKVFLFAGNWPVAANSTGQMSETWCPSLLRQFKTPARKAKARSRGLLLVISSSNPFFHAGQPSYLPETG